MKKIDYILITLALLCIYTLGYVTGYILGLKQMLKFISEVLI